VVPSSVSKQKEGCVRLTTRKGVSTAVPGVWTKPSHSMTPETSLQCGARHARHGHPRAAREIFTVAEYHTRSIMTGQASLTPKKQDGGKRVHVRAYTSVLQSRNQHCPRNVIAVVWLWYVIMIRT
jgi:hypothetical protein